MSARTGTATVQFACPELALPCLRMVLGMRFAYRLLLFLLVFGEGTVSASFTKFEGLGKYLGNVPIFGKWSVVSAVESSSLLKPQPPHPHLVMMHLQRRRCG